MYLLFANTLTLINVMGLQHEGTLAKMSICVTETWETVGANPCL